MSHSTIQRIRFPLLSSLPFRPTLRADLSPIAPQLSAPPRWTPKAKPYRSEGGRPAYAVATLGPG